MQKTPDEIKRQLITCTELNMPQEVQYKAMVDALAYISQLESQNRCFKEIKESCERRMIEMAQQMPSWTSVKERLPEYKGWVLVIGLLLKKKKGDYGWCVPHVAEYRHGRWCDSDGMMPDLEDRSLKITHWMPLPEPPEVKEE